MFFAACTPTCTARIWKFKFKFYLYFYFSGFFEDLITDSEKQMHKTFRTIYKPLYVNTSHITKALYSKLRKYYSDGSLPPKEIIKIFFQDISKKMFLLLNPTAKVDIDCVGNNMETVKPFGKVPRTVSVNIERSFNAARSFVYGFTTGKIVVARLTDLSLTEKCLKSVTRMTQCSHCHGQNNLKPCADYCKSVYAHCFASLMELEHVWDEYLTEMQNIAVKLEGRYDIEGVTRELPYDISEGIMNYQQQSATVSPKVSFQIFLRNVITYCLLSVNMFPCFACKHVLHVSSYNITEDATTGKILKMNFEILTMSKQTVL